MIKAGVLYIFQFFFRENGGRTWARTKDPLIKSQLLYQLSYASTSRENIDQKKGFRLRGRAISSAPLALQCPIQNRL